MTLFPKRTQPIVDLIIHILKEAVLLALLFVLALVLYRYGADFEVANPDGIRWVPIAFALSPLAFIYILLRLPLGSLTSAIVTLVITGVLILINDYKTALTGAPLSWSDMINRDNIAMSSTFVSAWLLVCIGIGLLIFCVIFWRISKHYLALRSWRSVILHLVALLFVAPLALQPYLEDISPAADAKLMDVLNRYGIMYFTWNWSENIRMNGFPMHLVQTSYRYMPAKPSAKDEAALHAIAPTPEHDATPKHVFYVLCEACWYDQKHFKQAVKPLEHAGMTALRGVSPGYGGGTANSAFEMLTGLPSKGALQGIIYQEYATLIANKTLTIPSAMREKGYKTFALHNFSKTFWQRDIVMTKLGFDDFLGIEDMNYAGPTYFPRDTVLYKTAMDILKKHINDKVFFNLETVYSHASYQPDHDEGQKDYARRLSVTMQDLAKFITDVRKISPDALFVVYGDHKPILTKYFYDEGVLPPEVFIATGDGNGDFSFSHSASQDLLGDVPVWIGSPRSELVSHVSNASHKPLYCITSAIDNVFLSSQNPASRYATEHLCANYIPGKYAETAKAMPAWLYAFSLFTTTTLDDH